MSFLVVGSEKGIYNEEEMIDQLKLWGADNPYSVIQVAIKKRKVVYDGYRILSIQ